MRISQIFPLIFLICGSETRKGPLAMINSAILRYLACMSAGSLLISSAASLVWTIIHPELDKII